VPTRTSGAPQRPEDTSGRRPESYRQLLALPGALGFFTAASTGRVGAAATGLGLVWLVHGARGSFAAAGAAVGAFAVAEAVASPQVARAVDRWGQAAVLPVVLAVHAAAVVALVEAVTGGAPSAVVVAAAAAAGASVAQLGALSSVRWAVLLDGHPDALPRAFALESLANAVAFLLGPVLVSALAAGASPWAGSAGAAALVLGGGLALAVQRRTAPRPGPRPPRRRRERGPQPAAASPRRALRRPLPVLLVLCSGLLGAHFGGLQITTAAWAGALGGPWAVAPLVAVSSGAGLLGAWLCGLRSWRTPPLVQVALAAGGIAAGCGLTALAAVAAADRTGPLPVALLAAGLALAGLVVPLVVVRVAVVLEREVPRAVLTEALAWTGSASAAGSAAGAALVGGLVDGAGPGAGSAALVVVALLLASGAALGARWRGRPRPCRRWGRRDWGRDGSAAGAAAAPERRCRRPRRRP